MATEANTQGVCTICGLSREECAKLAEAGGPVTPAHQIVFVRANDWEGIYVFNRLKDEGHRLDSTHVLNALSIAYTVEYADEKWLGNEGRLPLDLADCVFEE